MGKKIKYEPHPHFECKHGHLVKYTGDPVIAECQVTGERHVASTAVACPFFKKRDKNESVELRKKRLGITDVFI